MAPGGCLPALGGPAPVSWDMARVPPGHRVAAHLRPQIEHGAMCVRLAASQ